jgi:nucleotide-binding universal stress UspA family protein
MFQRILVCTDLEDGLQRLTGFASSFAVAGIRQVVFLHVIPLLDDREIPRPDEEKIEAVRAQLAGGMREIPDGINVQIEVRTGRAIDHILNVIKAYSIDLILVGMPSRTRLTEKLFGSTTMDLCRQVSTPLMILRPQLVSTYTIEELSLRCQHLFRYLLIPYDGSDAAGYLVNRIRHQAKNPQSTLESCLLCWIFDDVGRRGLDSYRENQMKAAENELAKVQTELANLGLDVKALVLQGNALGEVLRLAQDYDISAIALSSDSLGKILEWSIPSFAGEVLRRSWHPVIYFPPEK